MKNKIFFKFLICGVISSIVGFLNCFINLFSLPDYENMQVMQVNFITISTVFAGFSFTTLGVLLGMSSEKLIVRINKTSIIPRKIEKIICSIVFFVASVLISLIFVLGIPDLLQKIARVGDYIYSALYFIGLGFLITGVIYFIVSVYELSDLIKRVYDYNSNEDFNDLI